MISAWPSIELTICPSHNDVNAKTKFSLFPGEISFIYYNKSLATSYTSSDEKSAS